MVAAMVVLKPSHRGVRLPSQAEGELAGKDAKAIFSALFIRETYRLPPLLKRSANTIANLITNIKATTDADCVVLGGSVGALLTAISNCSSCYGTTTISITSADCISSLSS